MWSLPALTQWLALPDPSQRLAAAWSPAAAAQVSAYYTAHYCTHLSQPASRMAWASIPQVQDDAGLGGRGRCGGAWCGLVWGW